MFLLLLYILFVSGLLLGVDLFAFGFLYCDACVVPGVMLVWGALCWVFCCGCVCLIGLLAAFSVGWV